MERQASSSLGKLSAAAGATNASIPKNQGASTKEVRRGVMGVSLEYSENL
jgi:hypothetical protein